MSLWQGLQTSDATFCSHPGTGSYVHLYPTEYLVYGVEYPGIKEDVPRLRLFPNNQVEYRITDHLASVRTTLDGSGTVTNVYDYKPFGDILNGGTEARQGFNSREKDQELGLFNNGVRKLDDEEGRFTSIDPLWEKFPAWSPYQYGYNNPLKMTDPGGEQARPWAPDPIVGGGGGGGSIPLPIPVPAPTTGEIIGSLIGLAEVITGIVVQTQTETSTLTLPLQGTGIVTASGDKSAEELDKHVGDLADGRKRAAEIKDKLDKTKGHKDRQKLIKELKDEIREIAGHIKEITEMVRWKNWQI